MTARKLTADDVCAFCWAHLPEQTRGALCALANLNSTLAILEWYELSEAHKVEMRRELADLIEHNASHQRKQYLKEEGKAA